MIPKKTYILISVVLIVVGALLNRDLHLAGLILTLSVIAVYILTDAKLIFKYASKYRTTTSLQKIKLITSTAMILVFFTALIGGNVPYFLLLLALATDYMIYENK